MLRAITGYFFGGAVEEIPQTAVECETREVNDWLVVNMADRPADNIDMDDEIEVALVTDREYDEILDAVSCLMRTAELENDESLLEENCSETEELDSQTWSKSDESSSDESDETDDRMSVSSDSSVVSLQRTLDYLDREWEISMAAVMGITGRFCMHHEVVQNFGTEDRTAFLPSHKPTLMRLTQTKVHYPSGTECLQDYKRVVQVKSETEFYNHRIESLRNSLHQMYEQHALGSPKIIGMVYKCDGIVPSTTRRQIYASSTPLHFKYRPAAPKSDLMQKIKELEQEQKVRDYKIKKSITKGQLNRQNKNYIFDSSCKKNRRKNLQRNPSGANNNRKC